MFKDPEIRKGVIASIIAAILVVIFINPILNFLWKIIVSVGGLFLDKYIDMIYKGASLGHRNQNSVMVLGLMLSGLIGTALARIIVKIKPRDKSDATKVNHRKKNIIVDIILSVIVIIACLTLLINSFADLQLNASFDRRLTVLAPAISDIEYKQLRAQWALMKSRSDYLQLNNKMEELAAGRKIALPDVLIK